MSANESWHGSWRVGSESVHSPLSACLSGQGTKTPNCHESPFWSEACARQMKSTLLKCVFHSFWPEMCLDVVMQTQLFVSCLGGILVWKWTLMKSTWNGGRDTLPVWLSVMTLCVCVFHNCNHKLIWKNYKKIQSHLQRITRSRWLASPTAEHVIEKVYVISTV